MRTPSRFLVGVIALLGMSLTAPRANAAYLDLTTADSQGSINGALFVQGESKAGTGVFPSFVQIGGANLNVVEGYNTTVNGVLNNGQSDNFNRAVLVNQLSFVSFTPGGQVYIKLKLDINENTGNQQGNAQEFLSLDALQIYTSATPNQSTTNPADLGTLRYDIGAGNGLLMDYSLESGSGTSDVVAYIPLWAGAIGNEYFYLYSKFGALGVSGNRDYGNSDGFEEWANASASSGEIEEPPPDDVEVVPAPAGLVLLATAIPVLGLRRVLRRKTA